MNACGSACRRACREGLVLCLGAWRFPVTSRAHCGGLPVSMMAAAGAPGTREGCGGPGHAGSPETVVSSKTGPVLTQGSS